MILKNRSGREWEREEGAGHFFFSQGAERGPNLSASLPSPPKNGSPCRMAREGAPSN